MIGMESNKESRPFSWHQRRHIFFFCVHNFTALVDGGSICEGETMMEKLYIQMEYMDL
jgi:hypothetical protein